MDKESTAEDELRAFCDALDRDSPVDFSLESQRSIPFGMNRVVKKTEIGPILFVTRSTRLRVKLEGRLRADWGRFSFFTLGVDFEWVNTRGALRGQVARSRSSFTCPARATFSDFETSGSKNNKHRATGRKRTFEMLPNEIVSNVWLGGARFADDSTWNAFAREKKIRFVVTAGKELQGVCAGVDRLRVDVDDRPDVDLYRFFPGVCARLEGAFSRGEPTLVHCAAGVSRSVSLVVAWLMMRNDWSVETALAYVKARRPIANPNPGFCRQLKKWELYLTSLNDRRPFSASRTSKKKF